MSQRLLEDHELLGPDFRRGLADGLAWEPEQTDFRSSASAPVDETVWTLLVQSPLREEAASLAVLSEIEERLPSLRSRAYGEGFATGLRRVLQERVKQRWRTPKRWDGVLAQSSRAELQAMLRLLPQCRNWTEFFVRSVRGR